MALIFSIGFSVMDTPRRAIVCQCAPIVSEVEVDAVHIAEIDVPSAFVSEVNVTAIWPRDAGPC